MNLVCIANTLSFVCPIIINPKCGCILFIIDRTIPSFSPCMGYSISLNSFRRSVILRLVVSYSKSSFELFIGSEPEDKREIIGLTLQNLFLNQGKLEYKLQKTFDSIFEEADRLNWSTRWVDILTDEYIMQILNNCGEYEVVMKFSSFHVSA